MRWLAMGLVLAACAPPVEMDEFCRERRRAECESLQANCGYSRDIDCSKLEAVGDCLAYARVDLRAGDVHYDAAMARKCVDEVRASKNCFSDGYFASCLDVVHGDGGEGAVCGGCEAGLYCGPPTIDGRCGTCRPRGPRFRNVGDPCSLGGTCGAETQCDSASFRCVPLPMAGEACERTCAEGAWCRDGTCVRLPVQGEVCDRLCARGFFCRDGICAPRVKTGASCIDGVCELGLACADGTCVVPRQLGAACTSFDHCDRSSCIEGRCALGVAEGGACHAASCAPELECREATCRPLPGEGARCEGFCASGLVCFDGTCAVNSSECR